MIYQGHKVEFKLLPSFNNTVLIEATFPDLNFSHKHHKPEHLYNKDPEAIERLVAKQSLQAYQTLTESHHSPASPIK